MTSASRIRCFPQVLRGDARAATAIEFAVAAPVLITLLLGIYDIGHMVYVRSVLHGAVQQVARTNTIETVDTTAEDTWIRGLVRGVAPDATVTTKRVSYYDFADIARPEAWNDNNGNGVCDASESYTDENRNGRWDADVGTSDNGGASDVVIYTVTVVYKPVFPNPFLDNSDASRTLTATAVKKNQPYALQEKYGSAAGTCS